MPIFVQTDHHVIDVEKITFMDLLGGMPAGQAPLNVLIHFSDGRELRMSRDEARTLLAAIDDLHHRRTLIAHRVAFMAETSPARREPPRRRVATAHS